MNPTTITDYGIVGSAKEVDMTTTANCELHSARQPTPATHEATWRDSTRQTLTETVLVCGDCADDLTEGPGWTVAPFRAECGHKRVGRVCSYCEPESVR